MKFSTPHTTVRRTGTLLRCASLPSTYGWPTRSDRLVPPRRRRLPVVAEFPQFSFLDAEPIQLFLNLTSEPVDPDRSLTEIVLEVDDIHAPCAAMTAR